MTHFRSASKRRARHLRHGQAAAAPKMGANASPVPPQLEAQPVPPHGPVAHNGAPVAPPAALNPANPSVGRLRRNVGVVIRNREGKVLAGLRAHASGDKAWQLPQGGIEGREKPATAAYRELREETGLDPRAVKLVRELEHWIDYLLPPTIATNRKFSGQTQKWFLFDYLEAGLPDLKRATDDEFEQLAWVEIDWLIAHVIEFRKPVYKAVKKAFRL